MKAIKIDVVNKSVYYVEITGNENLCDHIDCEVFYCPHIFENFDSMLSGDKWLEPDNIYGCFILQDLKYPIINNSLILGTNTEGDELGDVKLTIEDVSEMIVFGSKSLAIEYQATMNKRVTFSAN